MADIELVIKIDEDVFTRLFDNGTENYGIANDDLFDIARAIRKGTPLPKGHGRLIDSKALGDYFWEHRSKLFTHKDLQSVIDHAPTIIEADKDGD